MWLHEFFHIKELADIGIAALLVGAQELKDTCSLLFSGCLVFSYWLTYITAFTSYITAFTSYITAFTSYITAFTSYITAFTHDQFQGGSFWVEGFR